MTVAIYTPYLDTIGGGERYMLTIAECLLRSSKVDLLLDTHLQSLNVTKLITQISDKLDLRLKNLNLVEAPIGSGSSFLKRNKFLKKYDILIALTDGSIFYSSAKKNILHVQAPIVNKSLTNIKNRIKLSSWNLVIYNSQFTKQTIEKYWNIKGVVVYPPVDVSQIKPLKKKKQILTVGRFFSFLREKKHAVMIQAFKELYDSNKLKEWSLILCGSAQEGDMDYIRELERLSNGYPVKILPNVKYQDLIKIYGESSIYWHAMGYGEDDPTKMEHFGITTVEAMAGGEVPIVIGKGGQKEIVREGENGFLWESLDEIKEKTLRVIDDQKLFKSISQKAQDRSKDFSKERFEEEILRIVND